MSIAFSSLMTRLERLVPARNGVPAYYGDMVADAVRQLGQDVPIITSTNLAIVAGQASYMLPSDFLFVIDLRSYQASNVPIVSSGLVPVPDAWYEDYYIEGGVIRFDPTPTYSLTRTLRYAAGYEQVDGAYPRLTENGGRIALLYAQYLVLAAQAAIAGQTAWKYAIGDESVDKSAVGTKLSEQANGLHQRYLQAVRGLRTYGTTARYDAAGAVAW